ncbi:cytochrome P450 [Streptomyces sp. NPDC002589]|uniref:cytochrome P450 n=1 Tax=Streptomyces sp. NPDC002589 TaxID=3154420 RepID=UPI00331C3617
MNEEFDGDLVEEHLADFVLDDRYSRFHRRDTPVSWWDYQGGRWMVAGYQEVCEAARDPETFSSRHELPNGTGSLGVMTPPTPVRAVPIELDPPEYQAYRSLLSPLFSPAAVRKLRPQFEEYTTWCIDQWIETGRAELFHQLAKLVPAMTTMHILGLPVEDAAIIADAVHVRGEDRFEMNSAWSILLSRTTEAIIARKAERRDDLISHLLDAEIDGRKFTDLELVEICFTFVIGGMATTARLTLGMLFYLGVHIGQRKRIADDPGLMGDLVEEMLRYFSPVPFLSRTATRDVCLGGQQIKKGDRVALGFAAANRDPKVFDEPDEIRVGRTPNRHLALGHGIHFCIGAVLGRAEASAMVEQVLRRIPDFRLVGDTWLDDADEQAPAAEEKRHARSWEDRVSSGLHVTFTPGERVGTAEIKLNS